MTTALDELRRWLEQSRARGFLGPGPIEAHIDHSLAAVTAWTEARGDEDAPDTALDLGSGGGVPGLVLVALTWPTTRWTLLDAQARRCAFLREAVAGLGADGRVTVRHGRAEDLGRERDHRQSHELVVARSFGAPGPTAECAAPLLVPGGLVLVSEPPEVPEGGRWPEGGLALLGLTRRRDRQDGSPWAVLQATGPLDDRYPRRAGVPGRKPLF